VYFAPHLTQISESSSLLLCAARLFEVVVCVYPSLGTARFRSLRLEKLQDANAE
jgi:hypothetical protein